MNVKLGVLGQVIYCVTFQRQIIHYVQTLES